jgi:hypothetical protein
MNIHPDYQLSEKPSLNLDNFLMEGDWICLSKYGNFPHSKFLQQFTKESAVMLVDHFQSNQSVIPIFIGHPDDDQFCHLPEHQDATPYAIVTQLEMRDSGLFFKAAWNSEKLEFIKESSLKFLSPRWLCNHLHTEGPNHVYEPSQLISVGLTNNPNLPLDPLPIGYFEELVALGKESQVAGFQSLEDTFKVLISVAQLPCDSEPSAVVDFYVSLVDQIEAFRETNNRLTQQMLVLENEAERNRKLFLSTQERLIDVEELLKNERELRLHPVLPTSSKTGKLKLFESNHNSRDKFMDCVNDYMKQTGQSFAQSWITMKQKYPLLFRAFKEESFSNDMS